MLDSRAIILMNALRNRVVLPSDKLVCEMDDKQFEKWYHRTSDLCFWKWVTCQAYLQVTENSVDRLHYHKIQFFKTKNHNFFADYERLG